MPGSIQDAVTLHNGVTLPALGLGTWQTPEGSTVERSIGWAFELGYRHVDTAAVYGNEKGVGNAVRSSGLPREQVFVTTKLWNDKQRQGYDACVKACDESLKKLGLDYVDLYLIHWAIPGKYKEAWRAMEAIHAAGKAKAIGVSNFAQHHLADLLRDAKVKPMVNQIEIHPRLWLRDLVGFCQNEGIVVEAWSPLMQGKINDVPEVKAIADRHGKTPGQVALRWNLQHGLVTLPKSVRRERIAENAALYDFELSAEEVATIDALGSNGRLGPSMDNVTF